MADSVDILINGKDNASQAFQSVQGGLRGLSHSLEQSLGPLRSFKALTELAFGFHVGRFFFSQLHEGLMKAGEGFGAALDSGQGFFESMVDGARKMVGLKTKVDETTESLKSLKTIAEAFNAATTAGGLAIFHGEGRKDLLEFPGLPNAREAEAAIAKYKEAIETAQGGSAGLCRIE